MHKQAVVACVLISSPPGQPQKTLRTFSTLTDKLLALGDWVATEGVTHVALEATASYWKPVVRHEALLDREGMKGPLLRAVAAVC